jgi:hypothetical protein
VPAGPPWVRDFDIERGGPMAVLVAVALLWPVLAVGLGILAGRVLRRADDERSTVGVVRPDHATPVRRGRRGQALAGSGSRR